MDGARGACISGRSFFPGTQPGARLFQKMIHLALLTLAQAAPPAGQSPGGFGGGFLLPMLAIFGLMYFLMIRPQQKKQKEAASMVAALKTGDEVITAGGIHGRISNVKDKSVILKIADNVKIEIEKASVTTVVKTSETEPKTA